MADRQPVLSVRDLVVEFSTENGVVRAVDNVSFDVYPNETVGLVGESGCGKTVTGLSLLGLIPSPPGRIVSGEILLEGRDLTKLSESALRELRGSDISMIFQEPMTALNPVFTIGNQMMDVLVFHEKLTRKQARAAALEMLAKVGIPVPEKRIDEYPHQLSGGMRQRVMIAMALSCNPKLLVADEPTTALDVTTQAQVLEQINKLQDEFHMAVILITHDLGVVAETCRRGIVMYCGRVIENASIDHLFKRPLHPYTSGLLNSIPRIRADRIVELPIIPGRVPDLRDLPDGCRFAARCDKATDLCTRESPPLTSFDQSDEYVACHFPGDDKEMASG
ncbi:MAG: ABC transporter ATP-binding protein [Gammaproteobacteria bacterium]